MTERTLARVALTWLTEPGDVAMHRLVAVHGPVAALELILSGHVEDAHLRSAVAARRRAADPYQVAELALRRAERLGARIAIPEDADWPLALDDLAGRAGIPRSTAVPRSAVVAGSAGVPRSAAVVVGSGAGADPETTPGPAAARNPATTVPLAAVQEPDDAEERRGRATGTDSAGPPGPGRAAVPFRGRVPGVDWATTGAGHMERNSRPPLCLWVRGSLSLGEAFQRSVAVVGARACTSYGDHVATGLGYGLAERGWTVVSGGAYGIDAAAHRGALSAGGVTVAVLACGVDRPYPAGNAALFDRIVDTGLLVSEWPPGAEPHRHRFLIRNRVIAAITAGTVVVEAAARSGATSTLRRAAALGRPAMVVPGPVTSAMSVGCHTMLREHPRVRVVTGPAEVLEEVGRIGFDLAPPPRGPTYVRDALDADAARLLEAMPLGRVVGPDEIALRAGLEVRTVLRKLGLLTDLGLLKRVEGGFQLVQGAHRATTDRASTDRATTDRASTDRAMTGLASMDHVTSDRVATDRATTGRAATGTGRAD